MSGMSIKITLGHLMLAVQSQATARVAEMTPPGAYKFRVAKLLEAVDKEAADFRKQNNALIQKHGITDDQGNPTMVGAPTMQVLAFNDAMQNLTEVEVVIPYEPIFWNKLGPDAQAKLTIGDVRNLGPLLVEDEALA